MDNGGISVENYLEKNLFLCKGMRMACSHILPEWGNVVRSGKVGENEFCQMGDLGIPQHRSPAHSIPQE